MLETGSSFTKLLSYYWSSHGTPQPQKIQQHAAPQLNGTIHIKVDSDGKPSVTRVESSTPGVKFNAYAGNTMVTQ